MDKYKNNQHGEIVNVFYIPKGLTKSDYEKIANNIENEFKITCLYDSNEQSIYFKPNEILNKCPIGCYLVQYSNNSYDFWGKEAFESRFTKFTDLDFTKPLMTKNLEYSVRIISQDGPKDSPLVGVVTDEFGKEYLYRWTIDGKRFLECDYGMDLINVPDNPYNDGIQRAIELVKEYQDSTISIHQLFDNLEKAKKPINL